MDVSKKSYCTKQFRTFKTALFDQALQLLFAPIRPPMRCNKRGDFRYMVKEVVLGCSSR